MHVDDIQVGMKVTVLAWRPRQRVVMGRDLTSTVVVMSDTSWMGDVLTVEALALTYISCRDARHGTAISIDTREAELMRLSKEYVEARLAMKENRG
jgi:hypothetical protein